MGEVADALYGLPHTEFIAARGQYVKDAKAAGQPDLAQRIGKLRRPTAAAWLINQLAREQPADMARLADLGDRLRAAHHDVDGTAIRELSRERQSMMGALVAGSREVGRNCGQPVSDSTVRELEDIFTAAFADADAAGTLASGRLTSAKDLLTGVPSWPDSAPSTAQAATPFAKPASRETPHKPAGRETPHKPEDGNEVAGATAATVSDLAEARRNKAKVELERLTSEVADAERVMEAAQDGADTATDDETDARKAVTRLRTELSNAEIAEKEVRERARTARRAHDDAERAVREARKRRDVAANRLAALGDEGS